MCSEGPGVYFQGSQLLIIARWKNQCGSHLSGQNVIRNYVSGTGGRFTDLQHITQVLSSSRRYANTGWPPALLKDENAQVFLHLLRDQRRSRDACIHSALVRLVSHFLLLSHVSAAKGLTHLLYPPFLFDEVSQNRAIL